MFRVVKVFISWSGDLSRQIARALRDWLPTLFESVEPYMSEHDNQAGMRWSSVIAQELDETNFGILCLTPDNLDAQWLLFEAGALSKSVDQSRVVPLLYNLRPADVSSPLSQFMMKEATREGMEGVVKAINATLSSPRRSPTSLKQAYEALWPRLEANLANLRDGVATEVQHRSDREILEEILELVRVQAFDRRTSGTVEVDMETLEEIWRQVQSRELPEDASVGMASDVLYINARRPESVAVVRGLVQEVGTQLCPGHWASIGIRVGGDDATIEFDTEVFR